jgi:hypothetical protein
MAGMSFPLGLKQFLSYRMQYSEITISDRPPTVMRSLDPPEKTS